MVSSIEFEADRLRQARQLALMTKKEVAEASGISPAAVGQYEAGISVPRRETLKRLAQALDVPVGFFAPGRPLQRLESSETYFESLRATTAKQRSRATSFAEQIWELSFALEAYVRFPPIDLPATSASQSEGLTPRQAALNTREAWGLGLEPVGHVVSQLEARGIVCAMAPPSGKELTARINAYSTLAFGRPIVVLTADRANDVLRHRFSAAHELGHLVLHGGSPSGEQWLEREADTFAAEFLTPSVMMLKELPRRLDFARLFRLSERWGVEVRSLIYRSQELGLFSESTARRAYIRLAQDPQNKRAIELYEGEVPTVLGAAFDIASERGVTVADLADQLEWKPSHVRELLGQESDSRPVLSIVR